MKILSAALLAVLTATSHALAAGESAYQVVVETQKAGKKVGSSSLVIMEGQKGEIKNVLSDATGTYFEVTVHRGTAKKLSLDYRFKDQTAKQSLEIAKTAVELAPGATETSKLKDSGGNDLELRVTVREGASVSTGAGAKVKEKVQLRE